MKSGLIRLYLYLLQRILKSQLLPQGGQTFQKIMVREKVFQNVNITFPFRKPCKARSTPSIACENGMFSEVIEKFDVEYMLASSSNISSRFSVPLSQQ